MCVCVCVCVCIWSCFLHDVLPRTWTIMLESALHDLFYEACQAYGFMVTMQSPGAYLGNVANYVASWQERMGRCTT